MDEETAYENRPGLPYTPPTRDLVETLQLRCIALRSQLRAFHPRCAEEADEYDRLEGELDELESQIVALEEGIGRGQH